MAVTHALLHPCAHVSRPKRTELGTGQRLERRRERQVDHMVRLLAEGASAAVSTVMRLLAAADDDAARASSGPPAGELS